MDYDYDLIEPIKYYNDTLKDKFENSAKKYFNKLVDESKIDIGENEVLVQEYKNLMRSKEDFDKKYKRLKILKAICLGFGIFFALITVLSASGKSPGLDILVNGVPAALFLSTYFLYVKKNIKGLKDIVDNYELKIQDVKAKCYDTMRELNKLFTSDMTTKLIKKLVPLLNLDDNFDIRRFEQLVRNYGFLESRDDNYSTLNLISGDILGNPFVFVKFLVHKIIDYSYTGSREISYTEYYYDSDGRRRSRTVYETLTATVYKPGPDYSNEIYLIYGNEAAPNLSFSRKPHNTATNKVINKVFNADKMKLRHLEKKSVKKGKSFQSMANEDFETQFHAYDRDNEQEFRLLFTALGQRNMIDFLNNDLYGDDLYFYKDKMINTIYCKHTDNWNIDNEAENYIHFDYVSCLNNYMKRSMQYFQDMYFTFVPLLSIPLYQQHKSLEYIYGHSFNYNFNRYTTEMIANKMDVSRFKPMLAKTTSMLKTYTIQSGEDTDLVKVVANSYRTEQRFDIVSVLAGNGSYYDVRVPWTLYIPVSKESTIEVLNANMDESAYKKLQYSEGFTEKMDSLSDEYVYKDKLFGILTNKTNIAYSNTIKNIFNN